MLAARRGRTRLEEAARRLSVLQQGASAFRSIGWLEKDGGQLWSDGQERPDPWALLGREAFPAAERDWRAAGKSAVPALSLAAPVMLRGAGGWHLAAFMPAIDAARSFDGLLVGDIDPGYFGRVYGSVARGDSRRWPSHAVPAVSAAARPNGTATWIRSSRAPGTAYQPRFASTR